jgi:hypothetical protein
MTPTAIERAANQFAAIAEAADTITDQAAFIAGALSGRYHFAASPVTPDEISTPYVDLVRRADGWYSKQLTVHHDMQIGSALYGRGGAR